MDSDPKQQQQQQEQQLYNCTAVVSWSRLSFATTPSLFSSLLRCLSPASSSSSPSSSAKVLLRDLHGSFRAATLNGLLGPSGSGKSTLLRCLSGNFTNTNNNNNGQLSPESVIIRQPDQQVVFLEQFAQQSVHQLLTVRQLLRYAFYFKNRKRNIEDDKNNNNNNNNNNNTPEDEPKSSALLASRMKAVMATLMLDGDRVLERRFADLSGGQQKRVVIAQEMMAIIENSSSTLLLVLDEPVTGLDSAAALEVVRALKRLAEGEG